MQKPLFDCLKNDIDSLLDHITSEYFSHETLKNQIMNVLNETYDALNKLDECRIENDHLGKFENDRTTVKKYIEYYQKLFYQAEENEDEDLKFRYGFLLAMYEDFLKNPERVFATLRLVIAGNTLYEIDYKFRVSYINFLSLHDPKTLFNIQRNYENRDLFLTLYKRLEGYQITHSKIVKSAGLKIFNFFNLLTKVQKTKLATHIEFLFATLGEDLKLESKHAGSVKVIGEFSGFILFDYQRNKGGELYDFGFEEAFNQIIKNLILTFKKQGNLGMVRRINNNRKRMEAGLLAHLLT